MFARAVEPRGTAGGPRTPWLVICGIWSVIAVFWLSWAAGRLAALVTGRPLAGPDFGPDFAAGAISGDWARLWPGINTAVVAVLYAARYVLIPLAFAVTLSVVNQKGPLFGALWPMKAFAFRSKWESADGLQCWAILSKENHER